MRKDARFFLILVILALIASQPSVLACRAPRTWTCSPELYGSGDGCHCNCGVFDPDCDLPFQTIVGCSTEPGDFAPFTCSYKGQCVLADNAELIDPTQGILLPVT